MAAKSMALGTKRKAASASKTETHKGSKKPRLEPDRGHSGKSNGSKLQQDITMGEQNGISHQKHGGVADRKAKQTSVGQKPTGKASAESKPANQRSAGQTPADTKSAEKKSVQKTPAKEKEKYRPTIKKRPPFRPQNQVPQDGPSLTHAEQRKLAQERKAAKPLGDQVHRTKKIWETLRRRDKVPLEERRLLVQELFEIISGRVRDFVLKHDAVRAVQTAIKYSSAEQRRQIARELSGSYAELAQSRYAKFLIGKLMSLGDPEIAALIVPGFYGLVRKLINHPEASWILDDIYRAAATSEQRALILREWYGPEFALLGAERQAAEARGNTTNAQVKDESATLVTSDLDEILQAEPSKRGPILRYLFDMINSLVQKRMTGFTSLHDAMLQYYIALTPETDQATEFMEMVRGDEGGDLLKNMAFTRSGARLVCLLLARGSAKDRRQLLRMFKDTVSIMSSDIHAHVVILAAYYLIDDTKMTAKTILPELLGEEPDQLVANVVAAANNPYARTALLFPLEGPSRSLFPSSHAADLALLNELKEIRTTTSKKDPDTRRLELVTALAPQLLSVISAAAPTLIQTGFGCQLVANVLLSDLISSEDKRAALEAVAEAATGSPDPDASTPHVSQTFHGGRLLKSLIAGGRYDRATGQVRRLTPSLDFADIFYPRVRDNLLAWASGPNSFVVLSLLESDNFAACQELRTRLGACRQELERVAGSKDPTPPKRGDGKKVEGAGSDGNVGTRMLLAHL